MNKREPQVKILVFPSTEIDRVAGVGTGDAFAVQDIFSGHLVQQQGEGGDDTNSPKRFNSLQWQGQRAFDSVDTSLEFIRFQKDGTVKRGVPGLAEAEGMGGWTLKPVVKPLNCTLTTDLPGDPLVDNDFDNLRWRPVKGDEWETFVPAEPPYKTYIRHRTQQPDRALEIVSQKRTRDTGLEIELIWANVCAFQDKDPGVRLVLIDKKLSIVWRRGNKSIAKPAIERWRNEPGKSGWVLWKKLDDAPSVTFQGRTLLRLQCINNMLVLDIDDKAYYFIDSRTRPGDKDEIPDLQPSGMSKEPLRLSVFGVDVAIGISEIECQKEGTLQRTVRAITARPESVGDTAKGVYGGWHAPGTKVRIDGRRDAHTVTYTVEMKASKQQERSPFVSLVGMLFEGSTAGETQAPIDVRPAALSMKYSSGEPGLMAMSEVQLELSRNLLDEHLPDWRTLLKPFAPVRVLAQWTYDAQGSIVEGGWTRVFEGYVAAFDQNVSDFNDKSLSLVLRDPLLRLKSPAGFVDERYGPLDLLFAYGSGGPVYDGQCVQYLLATELGQSVAGTLNGNGDALQFSDLKYPVFSPENDRVGYFGFQSMIRPSTQSSFLMAPPFGRDVLSWINESIAGPMDAVFFWGYSPYSQAFESDEHAFGTPPLVPVYGNIFFYYAALSEIRVLPDAIYLDDDVNKLISSVSVETLTDKMFNEAVVWGVKPKGTMESMVPSFHAGRATLPASHPNAAEHSWRRVMLDQHDFIGNIVDHEYAEALANEMLGYFADGIPRSVTVVMPRGDQTLRWGMRIQPKMQASGSDLEIGVNNQVFRIKRINHSWDFSGQNPDRAFVTEMVCRPA